MRQRTGKKKLQTETLPTCRGCPATPHIMLGRRSAAPGRDGATNLPSWAAVFEARANVVSFGPPQRQAKPCSASSGANPPLCLPLLRGRTQPAVGGASRHRGGAELCLAGTKPSPRGFSCPGSARGRVLAGFSTPRFVGGAWRRPGCCGRADLAQAVPTQGLMSIGPGWLAGCTGPLSSSL